MWPMSNMCSLILSSAVTFFFHFKIENMPHPKTNFKSILFIANEQYNEFALAFFLKRYTVFNFNFYFYFYFLNFIF